MKKKKEKIDFSKEFLEEAKQKYVDELTTKSAIHNDRYFKDQADIEIIKDYVATFDPTDAKNDDEIDKYSKQSIELEAEHNRKSRDELREIRLLEAKLKIVEKKLNDMLLNQTILDDMKDKKVDDKDESKSKRKSKIKSS